MASNTDLNLGSGGDKIATKERTHDGDATKVQVVTLAGVTGTEGSYTYGDINGDATNGLDVDVTRTSIQGNVDTAAGATQIGVAALAVRDDALAPLTEVDGDLTLQRTNARGAIWVALDSTAAQTVTLAAGTATNEVVGDAAHDAAAAGNPLLQGGYASAAAPTDVSADGDAVRSWHLRNGAQVTAISAAGALVGATSNALDVNVKSGGVAGIANDAALTVGTTEGLSVMGRASTATPSAVSADNDAVHQWMTRNGATVVDGSIVDDAAFTPGTSRVVPIAFQADESSTDSVDEGDAGTPRMTLDRKVIVTPYVHAAAGGWTPYKNLDCDETEDDIKTSPGKLGWIHVINLANAKRFIKFYNATAANVTVGTTTPVLSFPIPTMADTNGAGFAINLGDAGTFFDTAISVAATTAVGDSDTGAPGANEVVLNCGYI